MAKKERSLIGCVFFACIFICYPSLASSEEQVLRISILDVGEGDAIFVQAPNGESALIDTGSPLSAGRMVKMLSERDLESLSLLFFTHPHLDHIGGIFTLLDSYKVKHIIDNGQPLEKETRENDMFRWYSQLVRAHTNYGAARGGDAWDLGDVKFQVLWPPQGDLDSDWNKNSLVIQLRFGEFNALFMGDALISTELELLKLGIPANVSFVKAGHHGSKFTADESFVRHIKPKITAISVDKDNIRGYPDGQVVRRYAKYGKIYRTDQQGTINLIATKSGAVTVSSEKMP